MVPIARRFIALNVLLQWVGLVANIILMISIGLFLQMLPVSGLNADALMQLLMIAAITVVVRMACSSSAQYMGSRAASAAKEEIRTVVYGKLVSLGSSYSEHIGTSEAVQVSVEGTEQLEIYFGSYLPQLFYAFIAPITLFFFLAPLSLPSAGALLVCVPLIPLSIVAIQRIARRVIGVYWDSYADLGKTFLDNLEGLTTLKIYQADSARHREMNEEAEGFRKATMKLLSMQLNSIIVMDLFAFGGAALGIIVVLFQLSAGVATFAAAFSLVLLSSEFFIPMRTLGSLFHTAMNGIAAAEKMFKVLDLPNPCAGTEVIGAGPVELCCRKVGYSYDGTREVLSDIDFEVPKQGFVALVGESGSGKSTLAGVLAGRNASFTGTVTVNGVDIRDVSRDSLMKSITTVPSSSHLFTGTIRSNLLMGDDTAADGRLWDVLEQCRLADFVRHSGGLDMPVTEQGGNLSGGQRQRLCMARALLHDGALYLFDEATSNIDVESERAITDVIQGVAAQKTVIMISHRLSAICDADRIYVLKDGRIAESGAHEALLSQDGVYAQLWKQQAELEKFVPVYEGDGDRASASSVGNEATTRIAPAVTVPKAEQEAARTGPSPSHRSNFNVMRRLITLVGPLAPFMVLAIVLGMLGFFAAIFLIVFGAYGMLAALDTARAIPFELALLLVAVCGVARGPLRYGEQMCNHYIAFRLLALIRDKVFAAIRRLAPAKLEGHKKGDLVALVTADIELLEVFYAHTISPVAIAFLVSLGMVVFIGAHSLPLAAIALAAYLIIGVIVPLVSSKASGKAGRVFRHNVGDMNSFVLEGLRGLREVIQFGRGKARLQELVDRTRVLAKVESKLKMRMAASSSITNALVLIFDMIMLITAASLYGTGVIGFNDVLICTIAFMSSFGPVIAVAALGTSLQQTFASGARVLDLLDEKPQVEDVFEGKDIVFDGVEVSCVSFAYGEENVLSDIDVRVEPGSVVCIAGKSGSGKSTLLKLIMRFWDPTQGLISLSDVDLRQINTASLRDNESYMTQETHLFAGTIGENILLAAPGASKAALDEACRKASILDFIERLPQGYDTPVGELGDTLSGGERQRVGLARVFLHDAPLVLLDEPTSNLDSLNEAAVLRALASQRQDKTIVLVSHRKSTVTFADTTYSVESGRLS